MLRIRDVRLAWLAGLIAIVVLPPCPVVAQGRAEAVLLGVVTDSSSLVLPGVTIALVNVNTGVTRTAVTAHDGSYRVPALQAGTYEVTAQLDGFTTFRRTVVLTVSAEAALNVTLAAGNIAEVVTVTSEAPLVDVGKTEQSTTISEREVRNLPTNSRNFLEFALLSPGVVRARTSGAGWGGESGFSVSGSRGDQNGINVDGLTNRDYDAGTEVGNFSQEAIQEFQIVTQSYPAEYGSSAGGVINAITKSGANLFTGYGFTFLRDDAFDKPPFALTTNAQTGVIEAVQTDEAADFRRVIGGLSAGGPIVKDRTFFYTVVERSVSREPRVRTIQASTIQAVRNNAIPNLPDDATANVTYFEPRATRVSVKVDHNFTPRNSGSFRYSGSRSVNPGGSANGRNSIINAARATNRYNMFSGAINSVRSNRLLLSTRGQYNSSKGANDWELMGGSRNVLNFAPRITIGGGAGGSFGRSNAGGQIYNDETKWEVQSTVTWALPNHEVKFGGQFVNVQFLMDFQWELDGLWTFSDINAFNAGRPSNYRQAWGATGINMNSQIYNVFVQDEWRIHPTLTLNAGVRYEFNRYPTDLSSWEVKEGTINPSTGLEYSTGGQPQMAPGFINDTNNIMPRLGIAYTPDGGRTLFRASGGLFYGMHYISDMGNGLAWGGPPMQRIYVFTAAEATAIWNGVRDPASPFFNPSGARKLTNDFEQTLMAGGRPYSPIRHELDLKTPHSIQGTLGVERQVTERLAVTGSFLWSRGFNNVRNRNQNPQAATFYTAGSLLPTGDIAPYDVNLHFGPRPDPTLGESLLYENSGKVRFKGLSGGVTFRTSDVTTRASYTYTDSWDDSAAISIRQGPADLVHGAPGEWSRSILATKHRFVVSSVYVTPPTLPLWGRDWQVAGIVNLESGHPYQVWSGFDFNNDTTLTDRPLGVPRNSLWTDAIYNVDLRLGRRIPLKGRVRLEALFEMFNVFNRAHYDGYDDQLYRFDSGSNQYVPRPDFATFAASPELNRVDRTRDANEIGLNRLLRRSSVGAPFQGQLALRLHF